VSSTPDPFAQLDSERIADAIGAGVRSAMVSILDATGGYPMTREDILTAIREGTSEAVHLNDEGQGEERDRCRRIVEVVVGGAAASACDRGEVALVKLLDKLMQMAFRGIDSGKHLDSVNDVWPPAETE